MKRVASSAFPTLRRVFRGYMHEDFLVESGSPEAALRAFLTDAAPAERRQFKREAIRLLADAATLDFEELCDVLQQLGCRWIPASREAFIALLAGIAGVDKPPAR